MNSNPPSMEALLADRLSAANATLRATLHETEEYVRHEPTKAVLWAMLAGYVIRMLPMAAITSALLRLAIAAVRPAALLFGVAKLWDACQGPRTREQTELPFH
jgi:hypothetical protein